jgi:hypothetical protein
VTSEAKRNHRSRNGEILSILELVQMAQQQEKANG